MSRSSKGHFVARSLAIFTFIVAAACVVAEGCGTDNAVVGGTCAPPFSDCSHSCVDLSSDPLNCGACGNVCAPGGACVGGACTNGSLDGSSDGTSGDTSTDGQRNGDGNDDGAFDDAANRFVDGGDSGNNDSGDSGNLGDGGDGGPVCVPPFDTPQHCGNCATTCSTPNNLCVASDGGFACAPQCNAPLLPCNGTCVDESTDEFNCGMCNNFCPSFICVNGQCVGSLPGELVLIGHDYLTAFPSTVPQARVLTNAVFVRTVEPLRVLAYDRYSSTVARDNVNAILNAFATANSRTLKLTVTALDSDVTAIKTTSYDVFLMYDQPTAGANTLGPLGTTWKTALSSYATAGGVVVVLDGAQAADMPSFVTNTGLLNVTKQTSLLSPAQVVNTAPGDTVGSGVASPYKVTKDSAFFSTDPPSAKITYVIFDQTDNAPVVVHRLFN